MTAPSPHAAVPPPDELRAPAARAYLRVLVGLWLALLALAAARSESPEFRPWEVAVVDARWTFRPNARIEMDAVGDLAHTSGIRALERPRRVRFSTDAHGFRTPGAGREGPNAPLPRIVVVGDSFTVGAGLDDEQTVAARLEVYLGQRVYDYGLEHMAANLFIADRRFSELPPRVVIYAPASRAIRPLLAAAVPAQPAVQGNRRWPRPLSRACDWSTRDNGLIRTAVLTLQGLRYRIFGSEHVIHPEGEPALVLSLESQLLCEDPATRQVELCAQGVAALARTLARRGTRLVYSPIPESGTIYPELFPPAARARLVEPSFLDVLLARVRALGIQTVDLRPVFHAQRSPYLFLRDDSHWNARAVDIAARAWAASPEVRAALAPVGSRAR
ncbi:MAG: hypothetical protein AB7N76_15180 [Planctomycetota bacterium]